AEALAHDGHDDGPDRAHGAAFRRRGDPDEYGSQNQENQGKRRNQHEGHALGDLRQQAQAQQLVDNGQHEGDGAPDQYAENDFFIDRRIVPHQEDDPAYGGRDGYRHKDQQRRNAAAAVGFDERARLFGNGGSRLGAQPRQHDHVEDIQAGKRESRHDGAAIHVADGPPQLVGQDDQHQGRRNDLRQGARCGDHARGQPAVVAVAQHDGQGNQSHRNHGGRYHARGRGQHGADQ